jgi:CRP-like cAMP-binding protein
MTGLLNEENWIRDLPEHVRAAIEERMKVVELAAGQVLKQAGDAPEGLFQMQSGLVRLLGLHADGRQILIRLYRQGNTFGETPMVARRPYNHTTVALTPARICKVPLNDFWELYHRHPEIPEALCRKFAHNITSGFRMRELRSTHRLRGQIGSMLSNIAHYCGEPRGDADVSFSVPITQTDIAEHLEVTRQAVQRELAALKAEGIIEKRDKTWYITNVAALAAC